MDILSQATNQIIWKLNEIDKRVSQRSEQTSEIQELKISKEINEEKIKELEMSVEKLNSNLNNTSSHFKNLMTKNRELEEVIKGINKKK